jgi:hypothetical protein
VQRLYLCGHQSSYGGGVPSAVRAATNASLLVLADTAPEFCGILKKVTDGKLGGAEGRRVWEEMSARP